MVSTTGACCFFRPSDGALLSLSIGWSMANTASSDSTPRRAVFAIALLRELQVGCSKRNRQKPPLERDSSTRQRLEDRDTQTEKSQFAPELDPALDVPGPEHCDATATRATSAREERKSPAMAFKSRLLHCMSCSADLLSRQ